MTVEQAITFKCAGDTLLGILHRPAREPRKLGILIVVGGPQYRVGSHRQFVLMARQWAEAGFAVLRFDYRGMGDSGGAARTFDSVNEDIRAAIDAFLASMPTLGGVILFGLCDAASAVLLYCRSDARVKGVVTANPWVRTPQGEAKSYVRRYYGARLLQASFWRKLFSGEMELMKSVSGFVGSWRQARKGASTDGEPGFLGGMRAGLASFQGPLLVLISEHDLTAGEFTDLCRDAKPWREAAARRNVTIHPLAGADHTFSSRQALDAATRACIEWSTLEHSS